MGLDLNVICRYTKQELCLALQLACANVNHGSLAACRLEALMFDEEAVRQLEATVAQERAAVQKCQERVDELNSQLAGGQRLHTRPWAAAQTELANAASDWATGKLECSTTSAGCASQNQNLPVPGF